MTPRKDSDYYKLKQPIDKLMYLNGMPKQYIRGAEKELEFINFRGNMKTITAAQQKRAFDDLKTNGLSNSHTAFWLSNPHDRQALEASCQLLRSQAIQKGFKSFEFISPVEEIRYKDRKSETEAKDLYIMLGAHENDVEMTHRIRRWCRSPHGSAVWVVGVSSDPYRWVTEQMGFVPDFMFWFKKTGTSVG